MQNKNRYGGLKAPRIFADLGFEIDEHTTILDFGCGAGRNVQTFRRNGIPAFGCDIKFKNKQGVDTYAMERQGFLRRIDLANYKLPFDDNYFDLLFSDQVLEHVQNYDETIAELSRVLKPDGCSLHIFPSRYKLIESHVDVPLASCYRAEWWLSLWARLGIRNKFQSELTAAEVASRNRDYLNSSTNYLGKQAIGQYFRTHFAEVSWREDLYLRHLRRGGLTSRLLPQIPFLPRVVSTLKCRVIVAQQPR